MKYEVVTDPSGNIIVNIYDDNDELVLQQPFNPATGQAFQSEDEAKSWAESYIQSISESDTDSEAQDIPTLQVSFLKDGEVARIVDTGTPVTVNVELYFEKDGQKVYAPVNGRYVVPYFKDDIMVGATIIDIVNGQGAGVLTFKDSGIYTIKLDKILNAETMQQPSPLPKLANDVKLVVVEPLEQNVTTTS